MSKHYDDRRGSGRYPSSSSRSRDSSPRPRNDNELPEQFGRDKDGDRNLLEDDKNVLQKMKVSYTDGPLSNLAKCIDGSRKIKVYTRNFKEVRGICTGYCVAFDKHWNVVVTDADEAYLSPKAAKTPYLRAIEPEDPPLPDLAPKVPKKKKNKDVKMEEDDDCVIIKDEKEDKAATSATAESGEGKKKRKKKKKKNQMGNRNLNSVFIRGDNIVMIAILDEENRG